MGVGGGGGFKDFEKLLNGGGCQNKRGGIGANYILKRRAGCQVSYFFLFSEKFPFFPIFQQFFFDFHYFFSQKLKEATE